MEKNNWCLVADAADSAVAESYRETFAKIDVRITVSPPAQTLPRARYFLIIGGMPQRWMPKTPFLLCPDDRPLPDDFNFRAYGGILAESAAMMDGLQTRGAAYPATYHIPRGADDFADMVARFVWAATDTHPRWIDDGIYLGGDTAAISMPETIDRHRRFAAIRPEGCRVFPGIRHQTPWVGGAMSFRALARGALAAGVERFTIMEDDIALPADYAQTLETIHAYLGAREDWDYFAGLPLRVMPGTEVVRTDVFGGLEFVTLSKSVGMAYCIFSQRGLEALAKWDPERRDKGNMIDFYLAGLAGMRVVTALPCQFDLAADAQSSQWGFDNQRYRRLAAACEMGLRRLVRGGR